MSELEHARAMLAMAAKDLKAVEAMGNNLQFDDEIVGFHTQQAIEKSLKAWIAALGKVYPFTHDIDQLLSTLEEMGQNVKRFDELTRYIDFAIQFRYEEIVEPEDALDRAAALADVQELFDHVSAIIAGRQ